MSSPTPGTPPVPPTPKEPPKPLANILVVGVLTDKWEGSRVIGGRVKRVFISDNLKQIILDGLGPALNPKIPYPNGCNFTVNISIDPPDEEKDGEATDSGNDTGASKQGESS